MSVDLPLPMPTGRATSMVGAPNDVSASASGGGQDTASGFDALMAALGPVAVADDAGAGLPVATAPADQTPDPQVDTVAAQPTATAVLPQLIADLQSVLPQPAASVPADDATNNDAAVAAHDTHQSDADVAVAVTPPQAFPTVIDPAAPAPARPAALKARGPATDDAKADTDRDDQAPVVTIDAAVPAAVVAQVQVPVQTQAPAQSSKQPRPSAVAAPAAPVTPAPTMVDTAATVASTPASAADRSKVSDSKVANTDASQTAAPAAVPAPAQSQPKPADALAGSLKAVHKALAEDSDVQAVSAPRSQAPSAFSLQAQVDAPGAYTATGAQSAGTTQAGSNLARATVETLSNMAVQINRKLSEGNTKFAVELHPADLGKVEVTLSIARDGTTTAHLKFDTPVTAAAFQAQEGELRQQLAQTGLNLDNGSLTFSSRDDNSAGFNQAFAQMQQQNQPQGQQNRQSQARAFKNAQTVAADADASAAVDAGLLAQRANVSSTLALNLIV